MPQVRQTINLAISTIVLISCGGSKGSTNPPPNPDVISKFAGDSQVGAAGGALGAPLIVLVKDGTGAPAAGVVVTWSATGGGGNVGSATSSTDVNGQATVTRTLGPAAGFQHATASISGASGSPITFTSIAQIQGAFQLAVSGGNHQADTVLSTLAAPLQVIATDHTGAPVAGVVVAYSITSCSGNLSQGADTTDGTGHAQVGLTFTTAACALSARADVTGLVGSPAIFSETASAGQATQIAVKSGNGQAGPVGNALGSPHSVLVKDAYGNGATGVLVSWHVDAGDGSVSAPSVSTDATGTASVTRTLGAVPGVEHDTASAVGLAGSPVVFTDTAAAVVNISIHDDFYQPQHDTTSAGSFVKFTWGGTVGHSVTWDAAPGTLPTSSGIQTTGTLIVRLGQLGAYSYHCVVHGAPGSGMFGTIQVQ